MLKIENDDRCLPKFSMSVLMAKYNAIPPISNALKRNTPTKSAHDTFVVTVVVFRIDDGTWYILKIVMIKVVYDYLRFQILRFSFLLGIDSFILHGTKLLDCNR